MYVRSIKTKLMTTLAALLTIGMLLISIVIIMLWQRQALQDEVEKRGVFLELAAGSLDNVDRTWVQSDLSSGVNKYLLAGSIGCLRLHSSGGFESLVSSCDENDYLDALLTEVFQAGKAKHLFSGAGWGIFTFGNRELLMATPVYQNNALVGSVGFSQDLAPIYQAVRSDVKIVLIYLLANVIILSAVGFIRLVKIIVLPLERLVSLADNGVGQDGLLLFDSGHGDEFTQLSRSLNRMIEKIGADNEKLRASVSSLAKANENLRRNRQEMVRAEKLASVGRLSAGLAHEIGNPLAIITGYMEILASDDLSSEEKNQYVLRAGSELERINNLIKQLLDFSRLSKREVKVFSVNQILRDTIDLVQLKNKKSSIQFIQKLESKSDFVRANQDSMRQVILNCLLNAVDSIEEKDDGGAGMITLSTINRKSEKGNGAEIIITISDNGCGIDEENIEKIFDPFFTTKEVGRGTGLGLFVSHSIIENYGGRMRVESVAGLGTDLILELPVVG